MAGGEHEAMVAQCLDLPMTKRKGRAQDLAGGSPVRGRPKQSEEREKPTVAIVDPRSLTREGLVRVLDAADRFQLLAVSDPADLLALRDELSLDHGSILINLGAGLVTEDGTREGIAQLREAFPHAPIIIVSHQEDGRHIDEALRQGVRGYIPTTLTSRILVEAVRLILAGGTFVPAHAFTQALADRQRDDAIGNEAAVQQLYLEQLTPRQREVLDLLRQGKPNKIIAYELAMQESTVKVHVRQIMRKLRASNRTQAAFFASRRQD